MIVSILKKSICEFQTDPLPTCNIVWNTGGQTSTGICMRYANAFSAAYRLGDRVGLVIYEIKDDGSLVGSWTVAGEEGAGTETLTPTGH